MGMIGEAHRSMGRHCRLLEDSVIDGYRYVIVDFEVSPCILPEFCAYVEIPEGHPFLRMRLVQEIKDRIVCHGGLTYAINLAPFVLYECGRRNLWIGWDYAHNEDYGRKYTLEEIREEVKRVITQVRDAACGEDGGEQDANES